MEQITDSPIPFTYHRAKILLFFFFSAGIFSGTRNNASCVIRGGLCIPISYEHLFRKEEEDSGEKYNLQ